MVQFDPKVFTKPYAVEKIKYEMFFTQATIGIDFLSKTMYLEDRTVSPIYSIHHFFKSSYETARKHASAFCLVTI